MVCEGNRKHARKAVQSCELVYVMERRMMSDQYGKFWQYRNDLFFTFWAAESSGGAVLALKNDESFRSKKKTQRIRLISVSIASPLLRLKA